MFEICIKGDQGYSWWMGVSCSKHFQYSDQTAPKWLQIWMWVWVRIAQTSWKVGWYKSYHVKMLNVTLKWYDETTHHTVYIPVVDVAPSLRFWRQRHVVSLKCPVVRCCWETPMVYASQCERPSIAWWGWCMLRNLDAIHVVLRTLNQHFGLYLYMYTLHVHMSMIPWCLICILSIYI